jgi:low affinity Fe/Cu permease
MAEEIQAVRQSLTRLGELAAHPGAYGIIVVYAALWFVLDRDSLDWHAVATLAVWFMTLLIQRTEHRDTQALQAKLDELLHAHSQASNALQKLTTRSQRRSCAIGPRLVRGIRGAERDDRRKWEGRIGTRARVDWVLAYRLL